MSRWASIAESAERVFDWGGTKKAALFLIVSATSLAFSFFTPGLLPFDPAWVAVILCGVPIILEAAIGLATSFDVKADVLVSLALAASLFIGEYFAAGEVAVIMQLGALLETLTVAKACAGIGRLVNLTPRTARVLHDGGERVVAAEDVQVGDRVRVLPGETVPVDGTILSGRTSIDESAMTGEPLPADKTVGDAAKSGTVNQFGAFEMQAERVGEDSSLARMVRLVQSADAGKAKIVRLADRWATWIVLIALVAAAGTWLITGEAIRAVTVLVVFCPCALVLATPTAIMAAIGNATRHGILVREGDALERLANVGLVAFDKTGTLTYGRPEVVAARTLPSAELSDEDLFALIAAAESLSEHPLGKAVVRGWGERSTAELAPPSGFSLVPGRGVQATVGGRHVVAGNLEMLVDQGIHDIASLKASAAAHAGRGCTIAYTALDGQAVGFIALADTVRPAACETSRDIIALGIEPVLLTGDHAQAARHIAAQTCISSVEADCLPESKLAAVERFEHAGLAVCMVGDGINDAPALKRATVGVAMGGIGSDIAVDAADLVLVRDDIAALPYVLALGRRMMATIKLNMAFSITLNCGAIVLAATGVLDPIVGALVHNAGSILVIANSATLLTGRPRSPLRDGERGRKRADKAVDGG